ncbi:12914_t:CDS:2 [Acaulospora colombiana]|uniref:12914_t:CDS:1 n=1 Tax=Acaulospora colombiana TaxID=27376 RepID=A0ACA9L6K1_9GLOM|nr:12914_t:CDS:2 [Acaulospora colombiana]
MAILLENMLVPNTSRGEKWMEKFVDEGVGGEEEDSNSARNQQRAPTVLATRYLRRGLGTDEVVDVEVDCEYPSPLLIPPFSLVTIRPGHLDIIVGI